VRAEWSSVAQRPPTPRVRGRFAPRDGEDELGVEATQESNRALGHKQANANAESRSEQRHHPDSTSSPALTARAVSPGLARRDLPPALDHSPSAQGSKRGHTGQQATPMKPWRIMLSKPRTPWTRRSSSPMVLAFRSGAERFQAGRQLAGIGTRWHRQVIRAVVGRRPAGQSGAVDDDGVAEGPRASPGQPHRLALRAVSRGVTQPDHDVSKSLPSPAITRSRLGTERNSPAPTMAVPGLDNWRHAPGSPATTGVRTPARRHRQPRQRDGAQRAAPPARVCMPSISSGDAAPMAVNASGDTTPLA